MQSEQSPSRIGNVEALFKLQLHFLFCISRSGSTLIHGLLNDHSEIIQHPSFIKYYNFAASHPELLTISPDEIAKKFCSFPAHEVLFRPETGLHFEGRLGCSDDTKAEIDKRDFSKLFTYLLGKRQITHETILKGILAAFSWCLGQDLTEAKVFLCEIHHGDWLWASQEKERYNLNPPPQHDGIDLIKPDGVIFTVRHPVETIHSLEKIVSHSIPDPKGLELTFQTYLRLLAQDWDRIDKLETSGIRYLPVPLEQVRCDREVVLTKITNFLDVSSTDTALKSVTAFRLAWYGDSFSIRTDQPHKQQPLRPMALFNSDHAFLRLMVRSRIEYFGYSGPYPQWVYRAFDWLALFLGPIDRQYWHVGLKEYLDSIKKKLRLLLKAKDL